jgi:hypothetical protein
MSTNTRNVAHATTHRHAQAQKKGRFSWLATQHRKESEGNMGKLFREKTADSDRK